MASIYSQQIKSTAFWNDWCSPKHWLSRDGGRIFSWDMESTKYTNEKPSTQYLLIKGWVYDIYLLDLLSEFTDEKWSPLHLLIRKGDHTSYTSKILYTTFNLERWSTQHLLMRDGNSKEMASTAFILERWVSQHLLMRYGVHSIY